MFHHFLGFHVCFQQSLFSINLQTKQPQFLCFTWCTFILVQHCFPLEPSIKRSVFTRALGLTIKSWPSISQQNKTNIHYTSTIQYIYRPMPQKMYTEICLFLSKLSNKHLIGLCQTSNKICAYNFWNHIIFVCRVSTILSIRPPVSLSSETSTRKNFDEPRPCPSHDEAPRGRMDRTWPGNWMKVTWFLHGILWMEEILRQLMGSLPHYLKFYTAQVVQDFLHQQPKEKVIFKSALVGIMFVSRRVYRLYISIPDQDTQICVFWDLECIYIEMKNN